MLQLEGVITQLLLSGSAVTEGTYLLGSLQVG